MLQTVIVSAFYRCFSRDLIYAGRALLLRVVVSRQVRETPKGSVKSQLRLINTIWICDLAAFGLVLLDHQSPSYINIQPIYSAANEGDFIYHTEFMFDGHFRLKRRPASRAFGLHPLLRDNAKLRFNRLALPMWIEIAATE